MNVPKRPKDGPSGFKVMGGDDPAVLMFYRGQTTWILTDDGWELADLLDELLGWEPGFGSVDEDGARRAAKNLGRDFAPLPS